MNAVEIAASLGLTVEQVEAIQASAPVVVTTQAGSTTTAPLWSADELADRRANGAARRADESEALIAAALVRRGLAHQL